MTQARRKAVVLLSGGLDSTTCLAHALSKGFETYALSFDYGQRQTVELDRAREIAARLGATEHKVTTIDLRGDSALTGEHAVPKARSEDDIAKGIPVTYVPARNTVFLSLALSWAESIGCFDIYIGANAVDYSGYPDCRPEFLKAFEALANLGTTAAAEGRGEFSIHAPLLQLSKGDIVRLALELGAPLELTHTCYDPTPQGAACGACDACILRLKGFSEAGHKDPIAYADSAASSGP